MTRRAKSQVSLRDTAFSFITGILAGVIITLAVGASLKRAFSLQEECADARLLVCAETWDLWTE